MNEVSKARLQGFTALLDSNLMVFACLDVLDSIPSAARRNLSNAIFPLFGSDVCHNVPPLLRCQMRIGWHITKVPVMLLDAVFDRPVKHQVGMVIWPISRMNQWRSLVRPFAILAVTTGTVGKVEFFSCRQIGPEIRAGQMLTLADLLRVGFVTCRHEERYDCQERVKFLHAVWVDQRYTFL